ncbi:MAG TPA: sugar phosphate isomerase/epimerase family protein [Candidatus Brocadiia bacterium]|nr:sugar phosphate isomerase/epimerase family protein [Candidatus Brocadiia bacterium]
MKKCISQWAFKNQEQRSAAELFKTAKDAGFEGIELCVGMNGILTPETTQEQCGRLLETAKKADIKITSMASGLFWQFRPTSPDQAVVDTAKDILTKSLTIAGWLGVDSLLVIPGVVGCDFIPGCEVVPYDVCMKKAAAFVKSGLKAAKKSGCAMALEYVWNKFLLSPVEYRDFIDQFDNPLVGFYMDTGNMLNTGYPEQWIAIMKKRVKAVHFKDFRRDVATLEGFCDLLEGDVDWPAVMAALKAIKYKGPCTAEYFGLDDKALLKTSKAMDKILAM